MVPTRVVVQPHPQIVSDALTYGLGVVAPDIERGARRQRDDHGRDPRGFGDVDLAFAAQRR